MILGDTNNSISNWNEQTIRRLQSNRKCNVVDIIPTMGIEEEQVEEQEEQEEKQR